MKTDKSAKELAFLHDLYVATDWSERFAELVDKNIKLPDEGQVLYAECGTGNHALELREKLKDDVDLICTESDIERLRIAEAKAVAVKADIKFQNAPPNRLNFPASSFVAAVCDASFVPTANLLDIWKQLFKVVERDGSVGVVLPTAGSFGEFFSVFWEALFELEMTELGAEVEKLIVSLPTVSDVEDVSRNAGFKRIQTETTVELFEYETGEDFNRSPLISDFLLPIWTKFVPAKQQVKLLRKIEEVINDAREDLSFSLSVKMTLVTGQK